MFRLIRDSLFSRSSARLASTPAQMVPSVLQGPSFPLLSRLPFARTIKENMSDMRHAFDALQIPAPYRPKVTQLLTAHSACLDLRLSQGSPPSAQLTSIIATSLEKIFNTLHAKPNNITDAVQFQKEQIASLTVQLRDFEYIQTALQAEPVSIILPINCSEVIEDYRKLILAAQQKIQELQTPEQAIYRKLTEPKLRLLGSTVTATGDVIYATGKFNEFKHYKNHVLGVQESLQTLKIVKQINCENAPFRLRL